MKILVTGAHGFIGKNLCAQLKNIRDGKVKNPPVEIDEVFEFSRASSLADLDRCCAEADFIFHLAGVNRPENDNEFHEGNAELTARLASTLESHGNTSPVMLASSIQAMRDNPYGRSKLEAENILKSHSEKTGAPVLIYRLPNVFGKWIRPDYNSVVATFCHNIANDLPIKVNDPSTTLTLLYIDDLVYDLVAQTATAHPHTTVYPPIPATHQATLGDLAAMISRFSAMPSNLSVPDLTPGCLEKKLYSTYLSFLPDRKMAYDLKMNTDHRGSFTEIIRTANAGQFSVNISKPGITKGDHWHHTKNEKFLVVKGHGLIKQRDESTGHTVEMEVSGEKMKVVEMIPGYTHSITNLSDRDDLVTLMWCNESFDPQRPDTFSDPV